MNTKLRMGLKTCMLCLSLLLWGCGGGSSEGLVSSSNSDARVHVVVAGGSHTCALTGTGTVKCWGNNERGQLGSGRIDPDHTFSDVPVDVSGLGTGNKTVVGGWFHTCAVTAGGAVKCWGDNGSGQLGDRSTTNQAAPVEVIGLGSKVDTIAIGGAHSCALMTEKSVKCWGNNQNGQLGNGTNMDKSLSPVDVIGLRNVVVAIAAGGAHTCALTTNGAVSCWGYNEYGQLGDGTTVTKNIPVDVVGLSGGIAAIVAAASGGSHTCALTTSGAVKCWGQNIYGQLGDGTTQARNTPMDVVGLGSGVRAIAAGSAHTCALAQGGVVKCWGANGSGQLGDGSRTQRNIPVDVIGLGKEVIAIAAGGSHSCALTTTGEVKCWGSSLLGQLGDGVGNRRAAPVDVVGLESGLSAIAAGYARSCALNSAGAVKCWGYDISDFENVPGNVIGLDTGVSSITAWCALTTTSGVKCRRYYNGFVELADIVGLESEIRAIAGGVGGHNCALTTTGAVKCWGSNNFSQLGDGSLISSGIPVDVRGLDSPVSAVAVGRSHTCALTTAGGVKCWGSNQYGQLGGNSNTSINTVPISDKPVDVVGLGGGIIAIAAGGSHTCALTESRTAKCWGDNSSGQLGDGTVIQKNSPVDVVGLEAGVREIVLGGSHTCALTAEGTVKCWGKNNTGQLGNGSFIDSIIPVDVIGLEGEINAIVAGEYHTCALTKSGAVKCWGLNINGELGDGTRPYRLTPVDVGGVYESL